MTTNNKTFCILPWIHLNVNPNGKVYQCCITDYDNVCGNSNESTLEEIWNNDYMRGLRVKLLNGERHAGCNRCYTLEDSGISSFRENINVTYKNHIDNAIATTKPDGYSEEFKIIYWDFRFSNLCNFKCRMCGHELSSKWYDDMVEWFDKDNKIYNASRVIHIDNYSKKKIHQYIDQFIDTVEEIYFAGGEPLIMEEHYYILDRLLELGRTNITIRYNTNLSKLKYKNWDVLEYWKKFKNVHIFASIDAIGLPGEFIRSGSRWSQIADNIKRIVEYNPNILGVNITTQLMNVQLLPQTIDYLLSSGIMYHMILFNNVLSFPKHYSVQILSDEIKMKTKYKLLDHCQSLDENVRNHLLPQYEGVIDFMMQSDPEVNMHKKDLVNATNSLDKIRGESFVEIFPELAEWYKEIGQ